MAETQTAPNLGFGCTETAAKKLLEIMGQEKKDPVTMGLRVGVQGGGCSGLTYFMDFDVPGPNDKVFETHGAKVIVDPKSLMYIRGSVLEYNEGLMGSGFAVKNPNVKGSCGCGHSFTT